MLVNIIIWDFFHIVNTTKLKFVKKYNNQNRISHIRVLDFKYANRISHIRFWKKNMRFIAYSHIAYWIFEQNADLCIKMQFR